MAEQGTYRERVDPMVERLRIEQAERHQRAVLPGLSDERLRIVAERLAVDAVADGAAKARWVVVMGEMKARGLLC